MQTRPDGTFDFEPVTCRSIGASPAETKKMGLGSGIPTPFPVGKMPCAFDACRLVRSRGAGKEVLWLTCGNGYAVSRNFGHSTPFPRAGPDKPAGVAELAHLLYNRPSPPGLPRWGDELSASIGNRKTPSRMKTGTP